MIKKVMVPNPDEVENEFLGPIVESSKEQKELDEIQKLKAKIHQMSLMDMVKTNDLFKATQRLKEISLQQQGAALEKEFQQAIETDKRFDWATLSFK